MSQRSASREQVFAATSGWTMLIALPLVLAAVVLLGVFGFAPVPPPWFWVLAILTVLGAFIALFGFFIVNPNTSRVLVLLGRYRGTVRTDGFFWTNPFTSKRSVSLKAHNLSSETIKVNDMSGNPIEIGAVVVWQVRDTAQACFDVEDYFKYVDVQIETAVRHLAKCHPYDDPDDTTAIPSLRGDTEAVTVELRDELQQRLDRAGVEVLDARISHLAYAPEIAAAMLQRQQASAIIAARRKIVEGAVGMVEDALMLLGEHEIVDLDAERRATLVGNLLVVLCGQSSPQPVLNTGTLYT